MRVENERGADRYAAAGGSPPSDPEWAWARYEPNALRPWNLPLAAHLYRRAAFGAAWDQLQTALVEGPQKTVDRLLHPGADIAAFNLRYNGYESRPSDSASANELRAWWLLRMIHTPHALLEKMTLFWHGHFAVSNARVGSARLMREHIRLLRSHALGNFRSLLEAIQHDPAMFLSLDAGTNRKAAPNEAFPRWLLQKYLGGPGRYSDADAREAARAFTGWFVIRDQLREIPREHDLGTKQILGNAGPFRPGDVVDIVLKRRETPASIVRELYRWLISETEEPKEWVIKPLADDFAGDYDLLRAVETMLRSNLFFSPQAYRRRMKSPLEFALGIVQSLEGTVSTTNLADALARLGQNLLHPPTSAGWSGGRSWINLATLAGRQKLAAAMLDPGGPFGDKLDPREVAGKHGQATPKAAARFLLELFLAGDYEPKSVAAPGEPDPARALGQIVVEAASLPEYQLS